jgi:hypothetical protein
MAAIYRHLLKKTALQGRRTIFVSAVVIRQNFDLITVTTPGRFVVGFATGATPAPASQTVSSDWKSESPFLKLTKKK